MTVSLRPQAFGLLNVTAPEGMEADDVVATLAETAVEQVPELKVSIRMTGGAYILCVCIHIRGQGSAYILLWRQYPCDARCDHQR
jgi:hypothetical protein